MGASLYLEARYKGFPFLTAHEGGVPLDFSRSDGKTIAGYLVDELTDAPFVALLEQHFGLDLTPLKKVAYEGLDFESWVEDGYTKEEAHALITEREEANRASWQPPAELLAALDCLIAAWKAHASALPEVLADDEYFHLRRGWFLHDLTDLRTAVRAQEQAAAVRLCVI